MNLILIGMRGSGKSTVAKILSETLNLNLIDVDKLIELKAKKSASDIIKTNGLEYFRDLESEIVQNLPDKNKSIIATGGGTVEREINMQALKKDSLIIYLRTMPVTSAGRLANICDRPVLTGAGSMREDLENLYTIRKTVYEKWADIIVETDGKSFKEVADSILRELFEKL
ncbi:MAG: shikimate kinase, shikimate kinase / 3-dehydroquinate synthase [Candidatus Gottesmanbacteria bacterium GW2011_GWA2_43_14]|uniref:Shikimate kinase n=1 Tax=Candidatus Gottesmanbacteria bacterium GW2011_GWA2_43_14 TaxID=1618443 RepID=A0A0G1DKI8_9BACT|nr:MAG: shikimate kinase, shikimate kinase / 3-dehydroquinate synthase [Candidatus Gottesmanbacteria bacterium GW2011_GWA2_43_14]